MAPEDEMKYWRRFALLGWGIASVLSITLAFITTEVLGRG